VTVRNTWELFLSTKNPEDRETERKREKKFDLLVTESFKAAGCIPVCKPQLAAHLLLQDGMSKALEGKLLISILAGTTIGMMREWVPKSCTVVRSMPNTPSKVS